MTFNTFNFKALVSALGFVLVSACATDRGDIGDGTVGGSGSTDTACDPGKSQGCTCSDGRSGSQTCSDDGDKFGVCECSGSVPTNCTAGKSQGCTCSDGRSGSQVCNSSGSAYDACSCTGPLPGTGGNTGVGGATSTGVGGATTVVDNDVDDDGYVGSEFGGPDCNDANKAINPGAVEVCDSVDNDCDKQVDEGLNCTTPTVNANQTVSLKFTMPSSEPLVRSEGIKFWGQPYASNAWMNLCDTGVAGNVQVSGNVYTCSFVMEPGYEKRMFTVSVERLGSKIIYAAREEMGAIVLYGAFEIQGELMTKAHVVKNGLTVGGFNFTPDAA